MSKRWYDLRAFIKMFPKAKYYIFYGLRSNGKTHGALDLILDTHVKSGYKTQGAILRRWDVDFKGKRASSYFDSLVYDGEGKNKVKMYTNGKYDRVSYTSGKWYLAYYDDELEKVITAPDPFCFAFALSNMEHEKGNSYPGLHNGYIFMDEFMTRGMYLPGNEFVTFMQMISTLVRGDDSIKILMAANTVDMIGCPYFKEMGLTHVKNMKQGDVEVYNYGNSGLQVAVQFCDAPVEGKPSDVYFAFDNPRLKLITTGDAEFDIYPHMQQTIEKEDVIFSYFIEYDDVLMQADVVNKEDETFTFIHRKTTPVKHEKQDIVFTTEANPLNNYCGKLTKPINKAIRKLYWYYVANKVFYSDNEIGETVARYLYWCNNNK